MDHETYFKELDIGPFPSYYTEKLDS